MSNTVETKLIIKTQADDLEKAAALFKQLSEKANLSAGDIRNAYKQVAATVKSANTELSKGSVRGATGDMRLLGQTIGQVRSNVFNLIGAFAGVYTISQAIRSAVDAGFKWNMMIESNTVAFEYLLGSADAATKRMKELVSFAATTPFEFKEVAQANRVLENMSRGALSTADGMRLVGDAAAATNNDLQRTAFWIGRAYSGLSSGNAIGEATLRLVEMGLITADQQRMLNELAQSANGTSKAYEIMQGVFGRTGGAMEALSRTGEGLLSTTKDAYNELMGDATKKAYEAYFGLWEGYLTRAGYLQTKLEKYITRNEELLEKMRSSTSEVELDLNIEEVKKNLKDSIGELGASLNKSKPNLEAGSFETTLNRALMLGNEIASGDSMLAKIATAPAGFIGSKVIGGRVEELRDQMDAMRAIFTTLGDVKALGGKIDKDTTIELVKVMGSIEERAKYYGVATGDLRSVMEDLVDAQVKVDNTSKLKALFGEVDEPTKPGQPKTRKDLIGDAKETKAAVESLGMVEAAYLRVRDVNTEILSDTLKQYGTEQQKLTILQQEKLTLESNYKKMMEALSDEKVAELRKRANLTDEQKAMLDITQLANTRNTLTDEYNANLLRIKQSEESILKTLERQSDEIANQNSRSIRREISQVTRSATGTSRGVEVGLRGIEQAQYTTKDQDLEAKAKLFQQASSEMTMQLAQMVMIHEKAKSDLAAGLINPDAVEEAALGVERLKLQFEDLGVKMQEAGLSADGDIPGMLSQMTEAAWEFAEALGTVGDQASTALVGFLQAGIDTISNSMNDLILKGATVKQTFIGIWNGMVTAAVQALTKMVAEFIIKHTIMFAIQKLFGAQSAAVNTALAAQTATAWATAAAMASTATFGGAAAAGTAGLLAAVAAAHGMAGASSGFYTGGYTGGGNSHDVAGLVHKDEYVVNSRLLSELGGVTALEQLLSAGQSIPAGSVDVQDVDISGALGGIGESNPIINLALVSSHVEAKDYLRGKDGRNQILDISRRFGKV